jgi:hypothetical protein
MYALILTFYCRVDCTPKDIRQEPKGIVFLSQLLLLFQNCKFCFTPNPTTDVSQTGTMITVSSACNACKQTYVWKSLPYLLGLFAAGNLLLSFAILTAGGSVTKVLNILRTWESWPNEKEHVIIIRGTY